MRLITHDDCQKSSWASAICTTKFAYSKRRGISSIKFVSENQRDWDKLVPLFLLSYRSSQHESTIYTPSMLTSGREMKLPTDLMLGRPLEENQERSLPEFVGDLRERMDRIHQFAREKLKIHSESDKMKQRLDITSTETAFEPGDAVWLYASKRMKGRSPKLQKNWEGPYTIIKKINDLVYRIQLSPRSKPKVVHLERLARYTGHNAPDWTTAKEICEVEGEEMVSETTAADWFKRFNNGRTSLEEQPRSGRPSTMNNEAIE
ncbi:hypothetical protein NQ318_006701 [Aromia moschata]|uniref:HTH CENPB-type domain-containing protein n=1 Tax=Aromia moschata TaxID=1265417 RepID=A0AAV8YR60_9CUCU|nr:hypothetical protein NQ318_006701 [Aromia moschata]